MKDEEEKQGEEVDPAVLAMKAKLQEVKGDMMIKRKKI